MSGPAAPFANPKWRALARETDLATQLICSGANEIGRADHAAHGRYATAQFAFSNGLERLGKIILTADSLLARSKPLSDTELRAKGHSLSDILDEVEKVQFQRRMVLRYQRPTSKIAAQVMLSLDNFAAAGRGRYANLASLTGHESPHEPVKSWWKDVCEPILEKHFRGTALEARARHESRVFGNVLNQFSSTLYFHEDGSVITDPSQVSLMTHERTITQKWGRYYSLVHARWLAEVFTELTRGPGYEPGTEYLFAHYERMATLRVPDEFLQNRKSWPLQ